MTALLYFLNVTCSAGQSVLGKHYALKGGKASVFNINKALSGFLVFLLFGLWSGLSFHVPTCLLGVGYGMSLCLSMHAGFQALSVGPMALTSIVASFSLIIPFVFGITVWNEKLSAYAMIGMVFLLTAIVLLNFKKEGGISFKWSLFAFLTLFSNGICSLIQKFHQLYYPGKYRTEFMLFALLCVLFILTASAVVKHHKNQPFKFSAYGLASGVMNSAANYIVLYLSATEKASILFPIVSVVNVIAVWIAGRIVFQERLKFVQGIGLVSGIIAIVLLNIQR